MNTDIYKNAIVKSLMNSSKKRLLRKALSNSLFSC